MPMTPRRVAVLVLLAYLAILLVATLIPTRREAVEPILIPLSGVLRAFEEGGPVYGLGQAVGNVLLFMPLGLLLPSVVPGAGLRTVLLAGLAVSLGIELAQWRMGVGRQADIDDVWLNVAGAGIGYLLQRRG
jgi:glycopeptide antibiotics resistance protein